MSADDGPITFDRILCFGRTYLSVNFHTGLAAELPARQVGVMAGVDVVGAEGLVHVLIDVQAVELGSML
jgi:hypothetical protein